MTCNDMKSKLPDLLFQESTSVEPEALNAEVRSSLDAESELHLAACAACRQELAELRATIKLLDAWELPEPNPYFLTRLNARLNEERQAAPAGWFERLRARLV